MKRITKSLSAPGIRVNRSINETPARQFEPSSEQRFPIMFLRWFDPRNNIALRMYGPATKFPGIHPGRFSLPNNVTAD